METTENTKTCAWCGGEYESQFPTRYCTGNCAYQAYLEAQKEQLWAACNIPNLRRYRKPIDWIVQQNRRAWKYACKWNSKAKNLYLYGEEGVGKSALAKYLLCKEVERGRTVCMPSMHTIQQAAFRDSESELLREITCSTLLLDDIHDRCLNERGYSLIRMILNIRHESESKRTIITTNKNPTDIVVHIDSICGDGFGVQTMRRLAPSEKIHMTGKSYRKYMQTANF